jgi:biopolymer transport protein ExbD
MRLSSRKSARTVRFELSMVSMIDVVFLLLIFFLVTTTFVRPEVRVASAIRTQLESVSTSASDLEPARIEIVQRGAEFVYRIGRTESTHWETIENVLTTFRRKDAGAFVRCVDDAPFDLPARAIHACKRLGFEPVTYLQL